MDNVPNGIEVMGLKLVEMGASVEVSSFDGTWSAGLSGDRSLYADGHKTPWEAVDKLFDLWVAGGRPPMRLYSPEEAQALREWCQARSEWMDKGAIGGSPVPHRRVEVTHG